MERLFLWYSLGVEIWSVATALSIGQLAWTAASKVWGKSSMQAGGLS